MWSTQSVRAFVRRLRRASGAARVVITTKAADEIRAHGWDTDWALDLVASLSLLDFERREQSVVFEGTTIWVFCPETEEGAIWIRLTERDLVFVVSFHLAGEP